MDALLKIALDLDFCLTVVEGIFHPAALPLGGSSTQQAIVLVAVAVVLTRCLGLLGRVFKTLRMWWRIARSFRQPRRYVGPERRVSGDTRPWVGGRRATDL